MSYLSGVGIHFLGYKGGLNIMKVHTVKLKQDNMLCNKCLTNVVNSISRIDGIKELNVSLDKKVIKIVYENEKVSKEVIQNIVNDSITHRKLDYDIFNS